MIAAYNNPDDSSNGDSNSGGNSADNTNNDNDTNDVADEPENEAKKQLIAFRFINVLYLVSILFLNSMKEEGK